MSYIKDQFQLVRTSLLKEIESTDSSLFDIQPTGFNNTIHWHIGHVLTAGETFLLGYPNSDKLPSNYATLFGYGSKPSEWNGEVPSVEELVQQLKDQLNRLLSIPNEQFSAKLEQPFLGMNTVEGIANLLVVHESNHIGQIHAMKLIIESAKK